MGKNELPKSNLVDVWDVVLSNGVVGHFSEFITLDPDNFIANIPLSNKREFYIFFASEGEVSVSFSYQELSEGKREYFLSLSGGNFEERQGVVDKFNLRLGEVREEGGRTSIVNSGYKEEREGYFWRVHEV